MMVVVVVMVMVVYLKYGATLDNTLLSLNNNILRCTYVYGI